MAGIPATSSGVSGNGGGSTDERWVYKGRLDLVDVEVVVSSEWGGEQRRFEVLSPEGSFALYAGEKVSPRAMFLNRSPMFAVCSDRTRQRRVGEHDPAGQGTTTGFAQCDQSEFDLDIVGVHTTRQKVVASVTVSASCVVCISGRW